MKLIALVLFLLSFSAMAKLDADLSGNVEAQGRHAWNNQDAKDDLYQKWDQKDFYLIYGNLNGKVELNGSRVEANWFVRHSYSELYRDKYLAPQIYTYPNKLVARDIFQFQYKKQENNYQIESILNKLFYEWDYEEHKFAIGRMYINYGQGEIFNPINPFNQPTGLTSISQVAQGNDGMAFTFFVNENYSVDFYILGDKQQDGYSGQIEKTVWIHGEYQANEDLQLDYVLGQDQKRLKAGGQVSYQFPSIMVFGQTLYQSDYVDDTESHPMWDVMLGADQQVTSKWHVRFEGGYQKKNRFNQTIDFSSRFLPTEYFAALANQYDIHPLVKVGLTVINDFKTGFTYGLAKSTFNLKKDLEADIFAYSPVTKGSESSNVAQKLVTTDIGLALRAFF
ncbi:MAG: hypothetical protein AB7I27_15055 [Bacteriovoracaceae bacterium]